MTSPRKLAGAEQLREIDALAGVAVRVIYCEHERRQRGLVEHAMGIGLAVREVAKAAPDHRQRVLAQANRRAVRAAHERARRIDEAATARVECAAAIGRR